MRAVGYVAGVSLLLLAACGSRPVTGGERGRLLPLTDSLFGSGGSDTLRLGRMRSGEIVVQELLLDNRTAHPTAVVSCDRSCGCVDLEFDAQPIAAGEKRTVVVSFDSRGEQGWQLKRLDIRLAGAKRPLRLWIEAEVL